MTFKLAMQTIRQHIEEGRRYLVIELISGKAEVMKRDDIFQRPGGPGLMQIAMIGKIPYQKLQEGIFAHPTFAESLNNLFGSLK